MEYAPNKYFVPDVNHPQKDSSRSDLIGLRHSNFQTQTSYSNLLEPKRDGKIEHERKCLRLKTQEATTRSNPIAI